MISPSQLRDAISEYVTLTSSKRLFEQYTSSCIWDQGACYAIAHAAQRIAGRGEIYAAGAFRGKGMFEPLHAVLDIRGWCIDIVCLQRYAYRQALQVRYNYPFITLEPMANHDGFIRSPLFLDKVYIGLRKHIKE